LTKGLPLKSNDTVKSRGPRGAGRKKKERIAGEEWRTETTGGAAGLGRNALFQGEFTVNDGDSTVGKMKTIMKGLLLGCKQRKVNEGLDRVRRHNFWIGNEKGRRGRSKADLRAVCGRKNGSIFDLRKEGGWENGGHNPGGGQKNRQMSLSTYLVRGVKKDMDASSSPWEKRGTGLEAEREKDSQSEKAGGKATESGERRKQQECLEG